MSDDIEFYISVLNRGWTNFLICPGTRNFGIQDLQIMIGEFAPENSFKLSCKLLQGSLFYGLDFSKKKHAAMFKLKYYGRNNVKWVEWF